MITATIIEQFIIWGDEREFVRFLDGKSGGRDPVVQQVFRDPRESPALLNTHRGTAHAGRQRCAKERKFKISALSLNPELR